MTTPTTAPIWSAPVRYAEADQQGVVFNAHYLLYADEAMAAFCVEHGLDELLVGVRLKTSTLTWAAGARFGDTVDVHATCTKVGRTSLAMSFDIHAGGRSCCAVETVYVMADADGVPRPLTDDERSRLSGQVGERRGPA